MFCVFSSFFADAPNHRVLQTPFFPRLRSCAGLRACRPLASAIEPFQGALCLVYKVGTASFLVGAGFGVGFDWELDLDFF